MMMRRVISSVALCAALLLPATASATWSIVAVDKATGRVVIASATCVNQNDQFLMGVQAVIVPRCGRASTRPWACSWS